MSSYVKKFIFVSVSQNQTASLSAIPAIAISALQSIRKIVKFEKLILSGNIYYFGKIPASSGTVCSVGKLSKDFTEF